MPEVSSTKQILKSDIKTSSHSTGNDRFITNKEASVAEEAHMKFLNPDTFASTVDIENIKAEKQAVVEQKEWQKTLVRKSMKVSESIQKSMPQIPSVSINLNATPAFSVMSSIQARVMDPLIKIQERVNRQKQEFINITDKLAAIYGEKEKDIKDKLSDTFKKLIIKPFSLMAEVDTSMEQKDHHTQKQLRDRESDNQNEEKEEKTKKEDTLFRRVNYKLLEIKGEILNITRKIKDGLQEGHNNIKAQLHSGYKKLKRKIVGSLDTIDSLLEPTETEEANIKEE